MDTATLLIGGFFVLVFIIGVLSLLSAHRVDPPLENEEYLAENPELRELKEEQERDDE